MSLITSVSGIRGTIGGIPGDNLSPMDILQFTTAYARLLKIKTNTPRVVIGRDGRISGEMVASLVTATLQSMGVNVIQTGLSTTPTVEMAVLHHEADGGIIISASHNAKEWNALKLLNSEGEFISVDDGLLILKWAQECDTSYSGISSLGKMETDPGSIQRHVDAIISLPIICTELIRKKKYRVIADCINSTGALALPVLFQKLGVDYSLLNEEISGDFVHNAEPLPENLYQLTGAVKENFDLGIAVDPDVDRLACVDENGNYIGEEYTLVTVADYLLGIHSGNTVSNLSSTRALRDITLSHGGKYFASPVGEVHVVKKMKEVQAIIGGEGNGGIIYPKLHYGRDALVGIALILSHMAKSNSTLSQLRKSYPQYYMHKDKITVSPDRDFNQIINFLSTKYKEASVNLEDGCKIDFEDSWIHLRKSNTEPIVRLYCESVNSEKAKELCEQITFEIGQY